MTDNNHHHHHDDCECGERDEREVDLITLTLEDDTELTCIVLDQFSVDDKDYIALASYEDEESPIYLYQYEEGEGKEVELSTIEDDDEFEQVSAEFEKRMAELEDELYDDDLYEEELDTDTEE